MSYIPPHKRGNATNRAQVEPSRPTNGSKPREFSRGTRQNNRINVKDPAQQSKPVKSNRFKDIFSDYEKPSRKNGGYGNNYGNSRGSQPHDSTRRHNDRRGYGGYGGYNNRRGKAAMELSTRPVPSLERELFGDLAEQMSAGIDFEKYNDIPVEISGEDYPPAIEDFKSAGLAPALLSNIVRSGFHVPTPVQKYSIAVVTQRRDLMACAQTGSGKTAAFLFPVISNLLTQPSLVSDSHATKFSCYYPRSLVISPTRELSQQIYAQARKFLYCTGMRAVCIYGGSPISDQFKDLEGGVHILVATPGRLFDMIERGRISLSLCEYLTLDEADRMLDMGFEPQIRQIVEESDLITSENGRNTLMFSATFPVNIQKLAMDFLIDYIFLAVGRVGSTTDLIEQHLRQCDERDKFDELVGLMEQCEGLKLVFTATKRGADRVEYDLKKEGYQALSIHGDKTQREREYALECFRRGKIDTLVATDVAARGLDIPNVLYVIQYDLPSSIDDYVHRIGRTGRCGNKGEAIAFVNHTNSNVVRPLFELLEENNQEIPDWFRRMVSHLYTKTKKSRRNGRYGGRDARKGSRSSKMNSNARKGSRYSYNKNRGSNSGRYGGQW